jgi:RHS repeat-associated protein
VHALVDAAGSVVERYEYDAWGRVLGVFDGAGNALAATAIGNRYLWQGREYSWKTGLYCFRARWYDPITGRWLSNDPIGINGGLNQYVFCANNPVNCGDPNGRNPVALLAGLVGAVGGAVGAAAGTMTENILQNNPLWQGVGGSALDGAAGGLAAGFVTVATGSPLVGGFVGGVVQESYSSLRTGNPIDERNVVINSLIGGASSHLSDTIIEAYFDHLAPGIMEGLSGAIGTLVSMFADTFKGVCTP